MHLRSLIGFQFIQRSELSSLWHIPTLRGCKSISTPCCTKVRWNLQDAVVGSWTLCGCFAYLDSNVVCKTEQVSLHRISQMQHLNASESMCVLLETSWMDFWTIQGMLHLLGFFWHCKSMCRKAGVFRNMWSTAQVFGLFSRSKGCRSGSCCLPQLPM